MKFLITLFLASCLTSANGQSFTQLESQLYDNLNSHHGMGLFAYKDYKEMVVIYNSYAWFNLTMNEKSLVISYTQVTVEKDKQTEKSYSHKIRYADIKSFEYKDCGDIGSWGKEEEVAQSPRLFINYTVNGNPDNVRVGFNLKGNPKIIDELNQLLKEIQKRL